LTFLFESRDTVRWLKLPLRREQVTAFAAEAKIVIDHRKHSVEQALTPGQLRELAADLE
jgi:hypothetical protein